MNRLDFFRLFFLALVFFSIAGCTANTTLPETAVPSNLIPYRTPTPVVTSAATQTATDIPVPTATPILYTIIPNDTMNSIARRFGLTLEALLAANPDVNSQSLSIGQVLTIPSASADTTVLSLLSTPAPPDLGPVLCLPSGGETACMVPVYNTYPDALENVKVLVSLLDENGQTFTSQEAILPLNILPPGQTLPALAIFNGIPLNNSAMARIITSVRLQPGDSRYLQTDIQNLLVSVDWNGLTANMQGQVRLSEGEKSAVSLWLAGVAYDSDGQIVGFRRWEWNGSLEPGASQPFAFAVYSLGPLIDRVELVVEARP